jgi:alkylation response protein AidB-like acyl-CoA dehydrogenase
LKVFFFDTPKVLHFGLGNKELQERICKECLTGQKNICLAITEPGAGSDVANLSTTAVLDKGKKNRDIKKPESEKMQEKIPTPLPPRSTSGEG